MYEVKGCQSSEVIQLLSRFQNSPYVSYLIVAPQIHLRVTNRWVAVSGGPQDVERERVGDTSGGDVAPTPSGMLEMP